MSIYESITARALIQKGWSGDQKFKVKTIDGLDYLLRISPTDRLERRRLEFEQMKAIASLGIPMCLPIEFGLCHEGVYTIQTWINGSDASELIQAMPVSAQYRYGQDAGRILARIHSIPAPAETPKWEEHYSAKIDRKIDMYNSCGLKYDNDLPFLCYLRENRHLLKDRQQSLQHGDYHIGNMMIDHNGKLVIIDFDREDYGDPWEEFNRIFWSAQASPAFASGMVNGYFNDQIPLVFWKLLALYCCNNIIGSLPWAIPFGEEEIQVMRNQARTLLEWYDNMTKVIPSWYSANAY